ncbi:arylsulfatase [uncultured Draconibacterium sp.]|uniref:sulfatase family protein n=1 Tax=uncultured Draconibacterium sp. TaxID=1573823 RepID=UPI0025DD6EB5|nr:arylsulfatase [uncultured Draconibacterium sp.]
MTKILLLTIVAFGFCACSGTRTKKATRADNPNIVYIICDDLGYGDVQCLNPERGKILTPQIDRLAAEAMVFTDAHSGSSVCTPTRYGVLTGRYAWRSRLQNGVLSGGQEFEPLIAENQLTVPALLKQAGYTTAAMGKWHLGFALNDSLGNPVDVYPNGQRRPSPAPVGSTVPNGPTTRGFDTYLGFHHSASMETVIKDGKVIDNMPTIKMLQFLGTHASSYIAEQSKSDEPFFLYLALNSPHTPIVPSEAWQGKSGMSAYCDFVMETDDVVGQVLRALDDNGIAENTLVFFTSDNGCSFPAARGNQLENEFGHYASAQFRGGKSDIWEGGHRVPFIVKWPGKIKAGSLNNQVICLTSLLATCADIIGTDVPENAGEDSYSILALLKDSTAPSPYPAVIHHSISGKFSIRKGPWKLELCPGSGGWSSPGDIAARKNGLPEIQLYNMEADETEQNNVYEKYPEVVQELSSELMTLVEQGRTTAGAAEPNDVEVDIFKTEK